MKQKLMISVIIPAYNVQKYIEDCLDSIISSTYRNLEIIVVDDGSTDATGEICDKYAENNDRVIVIHKENGGLVSARKCGIDHAHGEYLAFVDGDDYIDSRLYSLIVDSLEKYNCETDMLIHSLVFTYGDRGENKLKCPSHELDWVDGTKKICSTEFDTLLNDNYEIVFPNSVVTKIFRTELLKQSMHYVNEDITKAEDLAFTLTYINKCKSIVLSNILDGYYYVQRSSSLTQAYDNKSIDRAAAFVDCVCCFAKKEKVSAIWNKVIYNEAYGIIMSDCVGCCFKHYGKFGIIGIIIFFRRMCRNDVIKNFYLNGVRNHYFANKNRENFAAQMASGRYLIALVSRIRKRY